MTVYKGQSLTDFTEAMMNEGTTERSPVNGNPRCFCMDEVGQRVDMGNQSKVVKVVLKENLTWSPKDVLQRIALSGLLQMLYRPH